MKQLDLNDGWTIQPLERGKPKGLPFPATVPGSAQDDLVNLGLIPDPFVGTNEGELQSLGKLDWRYSRTIEGEALGLSGASVRTLVFEGIDTVATISLNGQVLAKTQNQHRTISIDLSKHLRPGPNELVVLIKSSIGAANEASTEYYGPRPRPYPYPYEAIRKAAYTFGWDWGPVTFSAGIWKPVRIEEWSDARLASTLVTTGLEGDDGLINLTAEVQSSRLLEESPGDESEPEDSLWVALSVEGEEIGRKQVSRSPQRDPHEEEPTAITLRGRVPKVRRWWTHDLGSPELYEVQVSLLDGDGQVLDEEVRVVGFRDADWVIEPDLDGTSFQMRLNGKDLFIKGVNWVPDDPYLGKMTAERYEARIQDAVDAGVNLIRVWGGGVYELDEFYEACDRLGVMVWQDYLFACAAYPEEEPLRSEVQAEAEENTARLASHPSLVLLCGNNENVWGYEDWGWKELLEGKTWGEYYYFQLLPEVAGRLAPHVQYVPGSPFSPGSEHHPNDEDHGTTHLWEQWNRQDWATYRKHSPRFVSEFGWQAPPGWSTIQSAYTDDPLTPESPAMIAHQKAAEGNTKLMRGLVPHAPIPRETENWVWAMQLNQAWALRCALEHFRSGTPRTRGAIVWQLNDCWPVTSWSLVDSNGIRKPAWFATRRAFGPRLLTIQPGAEKQLELIAVNDLDADWSGTARLRALSPSGEVLGDESLSMSVKPGTKSVFVLPSALVEVASVIVVDLDGARATWMLKELRETPLPPADFDIEIGELTWEGEEESPVAPVSQTAPMTSGSREVDQEKQKRGQKKQELPITITANTLCLDVTLLADKIHPRLAVDSALVTLLPGESHTFILHVAPGVQEQLEGEAEPNAAFNLASVESSAWRQAISTANDLVA